MADITCALCGDHYEEMAGYEGTEQALGCASELRDDLVMGYFGSKVLDAMIARFVDGRPEGLTDGPVCDTCIQSRLDNGALEISIVIGGDLGDVDPGEAIMESLAQEAARGGEKAGTGGYQD